MRREEAFRELPLLQQAVCVIASASGGDTNRIRLLARADSYQTLAYFLPEDARRLNI